MDSKLRFKANIHFFDYSITKPFSVLNTEVKDFDLCINRLSTEGYITIYIPNKAHTAENLPRLFASTLIEFYNSGSHPIEFVFLVVASEAVSVPSNKSEPVLGFKLKVVDIFTYILQSSRVDDLKIDFLSKSYRNMILLDELINPIVEKLVSSDSPLSPREDSLYFFRKLIKKINTNGTLLIGQDTNSALNILPTPIAVPFISKKICYDCAGLASTITLILLT